MGSEDVVVEELLAVQRDAADDAVIETSFEDIRVTGVRFETQHVVREEGEGDGGAGFGVGLFIREVVVEGEPFTETGGADAAMDVHSFCGDVVPQRLACVDKRLVSSFACDACHACVEIAGPDGMAFRRFLFADRKMRLVVGVRKDVRAAQSVGRCVSALLPFDVVIMRLLAAFVDEIFREIQILLVSSRFRKFDKGELDFLMAWIAVFLVGTGAEDGCDVVGVTAEDVEHFPFACAAI